MELRKVFTKEDLADRRKLFEEILPEWEGIIRSLAFKLLRTRTIDRGLMGVEDIQNQLRATLWTAIDKYQTGRGAELHTWITNLLKQECSLIVEAHYNKVPRGYVTCAICGIHRKDLSRHVEDVHEMSVDEYRELYSDSRLEGIIMPLLPLTVVYDAEAPDEEGLDIEDPGAETAFDEVADNEWFRRNTDLIFKVLQKKQSINEKLAFAMILSGRYESDREIAEVLDVNFAKVGEVRMKAKIVFAILEDIPIENFTNAQNAKKIAKRMRHLLRPHVDELPATHA